MAQVDGTRASGYRERNSTADRTLDVLGMFTERRLRISAVEAAAELGVARSTVYRYLQTLTAERYLEEDPGGGYRLGLRTLELARLARRSYGLSDLALPALVELAESTHETVLLTRRSGDRVVCLEKIDDESHQLRLSYERGSVLPLNAGASAWVLLAWEDGSTVDRLLDATALTAATPSSLVTPTSIRARLAEIRARGYAVSRGELDPDALGIAAPVRDQRGRVVAGVSIVGIARRIAPEEGAVVEQVVRAADRITEGLALASE